MVQAHAHLGYAPAGAGLLYATQWFEHAQDVYGWFIGAHAREHLAAYFKLESYHAPGAMRFMRSAQDDVYGPWFESSAHGDVAVPHPPPVPEDLCHELARLQDQFIRHWLFFADDPDSAAQADALRARELTVRAVNVRADRLGKFRTTDGVWRYDAPGVDTGVLTTLSRHWPLDHRVHD